MLAWYRALWTSDRQVLRARLRTVTAPTLLLWGERDALIPFANAADYLAALPDARLASFPTAGHLPQEEVATESLGAVLGFLGPTTPFPGQNGLRFNK